jgi:hypothetical protein
LDYSNLAFAFRHINSHCVHKITSQK